LLIVEENGDCFVKGGEFELQFEVLEQPDARFYRVDFAVQEEGVPYAFAGRFREDAIREIGE
jgi:hypothetical protein